MTRNVVVVGFGSIGFHVCEALIKGVDGLALAAIAVPDGHQRDVAGLDVRRDLFVRPENLERYGNVVADCASADAFPHVANAGLFPGGTFLTVNAAALLKHPEAIDRSRKVGARIVIASGALAGLDAIKAASEGRIESIRLIIRKPPKGFSGLSLSDARDLPHLDQITEPVQLFAGSARLAAQHFPLNANVAASLSFAGIGPDLTQVQVWADPHIERNVHSVELISQDCKLTLEIENVPSALNPKTSRLAALSMVSRLRGLAADLVVGN